MLKEEFASAKHDVEHIEDMRQAIQESDDPDLEGVKDEEEYLQEQIIAGEVEPLRHYYGNPTKRNLWGVKSSVGCGVDPELSPLGIAYLKEIFEKKERTPHQEEIYQTIKLQERILATSDEAWKEALDKNAEFFGCMKHAPEREDNIYRDPEGIIYLRTIKFEGETDKIIKSMIKDDEEELSSLVNALSEHFGLSDYMRIFSTEGAGAILKHIKHLKEKGLDDLNSLYVYPSFYRFDIHDNSYYLRFFYYKGRYGFDDSGTHAESDARKMFRGWDDYLSSLNDVRVTVIDEKIKPISTRARIKKKLEGVYASSNKPEEKA